MIIKSTLVIPEYFNSFPVDQLVIHANKTAAQRRKIVSAMKNSWAELAVQGPGSHLSVLLSPRLFISCFSPPHHIRFNSTNLIGYSSLLTIYNYNYSILVCYHEPADDHGLVHAEGGHQELRGLGQEHQQGQHEGGHREQRGHPHKLRDLAAENGKC